MEDRFISITKEIRAFQFTGKPRQLKPDWFWEAEKRGDVSITVNSKEQYITIYANNQMTRAYPKDWVCITRHNKIFCLDAERFAADFKQKGVSNNQYRCDLTIDLEDAINGRHT